MKKTLAPTLTLVVLLFPLLLSAQNLVNNPSFETVTAEPYWGCEITYATGWLNPSNGTCPNNGTATPDLFSTFSTGQAVLPNTFMGTTNARTGNRIAGIVTYHAQLTNYREYLMTRLTCPLVPGETYTVSFWSTGGNPAQYIYHTNNIGVNFSVNPLTQTNYNLIPAITPQLEITTVVANTTWTYYSFTFTPTQAFNYITIGNFRNDANTQKQNFGTNRPYSYYFFDDISVTSANTSAGISLGNDTTYCGNFSRVLSTGNPSTVWSTGVTASQITVTTPGTYWATFTGSCGPISDTITITQNSQPQTFNLGNDTAYCGSFSRVLSSGNPSTVWSTGVTGAQISVNYGGTYWGTLSTACGTSSDTIVLTEYNQPVVNLGNDTSVCSGQTTILNAGNPGATYQWQDNSGAQTYIVTTAGNYAVTVTNINGCSATDNVNVTTVTGPPAINIGNDTAYCGTFSRVLTSGNPSTVWNTGVTGAQITVNFGGTYWGTVSNSCGTNGDTVVITEYNQPVVNLGNDTSVCTGQTTILNAGNPGATYHWQDNSGAQTYNVTTAGNYAVTVTNINGCSASDAISVINVSGPPAIAIGNDTAYCGTFSRVLISGNPNTLWSTGVIGAQITVNFGGAYWGTVSNACGANSDTVIITEYNQPVLNLGNDTAICPGQTIILNAQNPGATYQWQDNSGAQTLTVTSAGNYAVTVTNINGCSASDAIAITSLQGPPVVNLGNDTSYCGAFSQTLSTGDNNTLWSTGVTAPQITAISPGVYWAQLSNVCGTTTDSILLTQNPVPVVNLGNDTVLCTGNNLILNTGNPGAGYVWSDNSTAATYTVTSAGNYAVTVTNSAGCTATDNINVAYLSQLPVLNIGPDTTYCGTFSRTLISDSINSVWSTGSNSQQITINTPGVYWAETSNACGTTRDSIIVLQNPIPTIGLGNDTPICNGQTIILQPVSSGGSLVWSDGSTGATLEVNTAGVYWVQVTANGCSSHDTLRISVGMLPVVNLGPDTIVCGSLHTLSLNIPGATYLWKNNSVDSFYNVTQSGTYTVTVTNTCGSSTGEVQIELHADECAVLIPTAFSPNEDGANDLFRGICRCPAENYELEIYNRWGELVFKADDIRDGWNGKYQNLQQPLGVYVYQLSYYSYCAQKKVYRKGNVTLVR